VPGVTVNRLCGSGLNAVGDAARAIRAGEIEFAIAGGVESMTRAPFVTGKAAEAFQRTADMQDTTIGWRFTNPALAKLHHPYSMGETAENVAERYGISRQAQDAFAAESQRRACAAQASGVLGEEIVPVEVPQRKGDPVRVEKDEHPRPDSTVEALARLKPAFREGGTVTAGNSSGINDGACALLVTSEERARALGLRPLARLVTAAVAGVDPAVMGLGPVPASRLALARAGLRVDDMDLIELNEAFAAQVLACARDLEIPMDRLNVNGGGIALGHPLGMSGARILTTLIYELRRRRGRYGLATMCIGVGQGIAAVVEALQD
jgi:acetyl-CoA acetyltransferase family protein